MKRILLLAAGALGTAGMIAMAAPASAAPASGDKVPSDPRQFQQYVQSELGKFGKSIEAETAVNEFLKGNCGDSVDGCPTKDARPGVLNQFDFFLRDLQSQSARFGISIDPKEQLKTFGESITTAPSFGEDESSE